MTTFEGLILLAAVAAVIIIAVGVDVIAKKLDDLRIVAQELRGVLNDLAINSKKGGQDD